MIFLYADSTVAVFKFKGKRRKLVENAYSVLASRSYQARFDWYMTQFREKDYVLYCPSYHTEKLLIKMSETAKEDWAKHLKSADPIQAVLMATFAGEKAPAPDTYVRVKIYQDGILQVHHKGTYKQVNLKKAHKEGKLGLSGTEASSFFQTHTRFDPHQIIISEKKKCKPEEDILFHAGLDNGVICEIIAQIAKS